MLLSLFAQFDVYGQCPVPANILLNPDFEEFGPPCAPNSPVPINAAFNNGCVPHWQAANTTPSICAPDAANGLLFACLGFNNEAIFQQVDLCEGEVYQLTFSYRLNYSCDDPPCGPPPTAPLNVFLASGLVNVATNDSPDISMTGWTTLQTVITTEIWQTTTITFTANNVANNQLVFMATSAGDIFLDNMFLTCTPQAQPQITTTALGGGAYGFSGSSSAQIVDWCWDFGDGSTGNGANTNHTYATPGTYEVCLTTTTNCGCISSTCEVVVYTLDPCQCGEVSEVLPPGVQIWNNVNVNMDRDVIIPPGTHLQVISSTVSARRGCKFVVMRGASLRVNASTLTSLCAPQRWDGIVVWGNSAFPHAPGANHLGVNVANPQNNPLNAPGVLITQNNSRLEHMSRNGMHAQRWGFDGKNEALFQNITGVPYTAAANYGEFYGGVIRALSTTFHNNRLSAEILNFPFPNNALFSSCNFTRNVPISVPTVNGDEGVNIFGTDGVAFLNCNFTRFGARGITAGDAGITVRSSEFRGLFHGILTGSSATPSATVGIGLGGAQFANDFIENEFGVSSNGVYQLDVLENLFDDNYTAGIRVAGPTTYRIDNNNFSGNESGVELLNNQIGSAQFITCGLHNGDNYAIMARGNCQGMTFEDNEFNTLSGDLWVRRENNTPGEIFLNQGLPLNPVYNLFSESESENDVVSSLYPGETFLFNYYPGVSEQSPAINPRLIPDCDVNDACTVLHNFLNYQVFPGEPGDCLDLFPGLESPCTNRACLDSLRSRIQWLEQQVNAGQLQHKPDLAATERSFNTDRMDLLWKWYGEGNMSLIEQTLNQYGTAYDQQLLFGFYLKNKQYGKADTILNSLSQTSVDEERYVGIQRINLAHTRSPAVFVPSVVQDSLLEVVATTTTKEGANARMIYYKIHGEWIEPIVDESSPRQNADEGVMQAAADVVRVVPNPADTWLDVTSEAYADGTIQLMDAQGKVVYRQAAWPGQGRLYTQDLHPGLYLLQISDVSGRNTVVKVVIQH